MKQRVKAEDNLTLIRAKRARREPLTQAETAALLGMVRGQVWNIEQRALAKIRAAFEREHAGKEAREVQ